MHKSIKYSSIKIGNPQKAIIAIHGFKGNSKSFYFLSDIMKINNIEWFFPEAPYVIDKNINTRSWSYEISDGNYDVTKTKEQFPIFLVEKVFSKYNPESVFFIGFSQGAVVCYEYALYLNYKIGGVFPIAGFFRDSKLKKPRFHPIQKDTPIIIGHGIKDDIVPIEQSRLIYKTLKNQNANVKLVEYNGRHKINLDYLKEITKFIND
tara:strand:+ start:2261 stop:2881 length:621 start_codon:yes stop_codon:yes gene_type:complete